MIRKMIVLALALGVSSITTREAAAASIGDKNLPLVNGRKVKHVYSVTGVYDFGDLATVFFCTSTQKTGGDTIEVGIQVFGSGGTLLNDFTAGGAPGAFSIEPGRTSTSATTATSAFAEQDLLGTGAVAQGSARILATSDKLLCTAAIVDHVNNPPLLMSPLPVFKKTKQQGQ